MLNVVVTGGGTVAPIDDVRAITNASTGRFSAEITERCLERGATVWHVHTPTAVRPFERDAAIDLETIDFEDEVRRLSHLTETYRRHRARLHRVGLATGTVAEYARALREVLDGHRIDVVFLAMAVSDYEPGPVSGKLSSDADELVIRCRRTPKVIGSARAWCPEGFLVGFKLLSGASESELIEAARVSGRRNRTDLTVANDLKLLRAGRHTIHLVPPEGDVETVGPGTAVGETLVERVFQRATARRGGS